MNSYVQRWCHEGACYGVLRVGVYPGLSTNFPLQVFSRQQSWSCSAAENSWTALPVCVLDESFLFSSCVIEKGRRKEKKWLACHLENVYMTLWLFVGELLCRPLSQNCSDQIFCQSLWFLNLPTTSNLSELSLPPSCRLSCHRWIRDAICLSYLIHHSHQYHMHTLHVCSRRFCNGVESWCAIMWKVSRELFSHHKGTKGNKILEQLIHLMFQTEDNPEIALYCSVPWKSVLTPTTRKRTWSCSITSVSGSALSLLW